MQHQPGGDDDPLAAVLDTSSSTYFFNVIVKPLSDTWLGPTCRRSQCQLGILSGTEDCTHKLQLAAVNWLHDRLPRAWH